MNDDIIKFEKWDTVKLLVNDKSLDRQTLHELLLHEIVYASALEINLLSIFMLTEMKLCVIVNETDKFSEIQSLKNHNLTIVNLILMNNLYFLDVVKDSAITKDSSMQVNTASKKSNCRQWQNAMRFIKIWHHHLDHLNIDDVKNIQQITLRVRFHKLTKIKQKTK